jgi:hypothetical protein
MAKRRRKTEMFSQRTTSGKTQVPRGWYMCEKMGEPVEGSHIIPCKVPLSSAYNVPEPQRFTPSALIAHQAALGRKIGLVIDLTSSNRYYDGSLEYAERGIEYLRIREQGHSKIPRRSSTAAFCRAVADFLRRHPRNFVGVHCTHGLNRTGFMVITLLVDMMGYSLKQAIAAFAAARPPGLIDAKYVVALHQTYDVPPPSTLPPPPPWRKSKGLRCTSRDAQSYIVGEKAVAGVHGENQIATVGDIDEAELGSAGEDRLRGADLCEVADPVIRQQSEGNEGDTRSWAAWLLKRAGVESLAGTVVILRGLPGSGKSSFARALAGACSRVGKPGGEGRSIGGRAAVVCSADDYFERLGKFDAGLLAQAHQACQQRYH